jgi:hypothetical protein
MTLWAMGNQSFNKGFWATNEVPGTMLDAGDTKGDKLWTQGEHSIIVRKRENRPGNQRKITWFWYKKQKG